MAKEQDLTEYQRMMLAKGEALHQYATLESSLALLFSILLSAPLEKSYTIFYRIAAARTRKAILEDLFTQSAFAEYQPGFNSIMKAVGQLDERRNQVAHWHAIFGTPIGADPEKIKGVALRNPTRPTYSDSGSSSLSVEALRLFGQECLFWTGWTATLIDVIGGFWAPDIAPAHIASSRDKFRQPIKNPYRPDPAKKSRQRNTKPKRPPRSSR